MGRAKEILITCTVICLTVLNYFNLNRHVPDLEPEYSKYVYSLYFWLYLSCALMCGCYFSGIKNRLTNSCMIVNFAMFIILSFKAHNHKIADNNLYDTTFTVIGIIFSLAYLFKPYYFKTLTLGKHALNSIYAQCQKNKKRSD